MAKQIVYSDQSRQAILLGVNQLADAVKVTLGPQGATSFWTRRSEEHKNAATPAAWAEACTEKFSSKCVEHPSHSGRRGRTAKKG